MDLFATGIRPAIDAYLEAEAARVRNYGDYWSASSAGYYMRKVIMDRLQVPPIAKDPRKQRVFSSGHIFHEWIQGITKQTGLSIASEVELQDEELMVRGHFDDLVLIKSKLETDLRYDGDGDFSEVDVSGPDHLILYDYKTAHSKSFSYSQGRPMSYYHRMQLGTYMYMLRGMKFEAFMPATTKTEYGSKTEPTRQYFDTKNLTEARILTISKDDLRMAEKQLFWTDELRERVFNYWTKLNEYWGNKAWPPCTCKDYEGGFLATEKYNPYFYGGQPCSLDYIKRLDKEETWQLPAEWK